MCGLNGYTFKDTEKIVKMNKLLVHRGPDSFGAYSDDNITLGHRRLKIIDLSEKADQPMSINDGKLTIVFNGEIYNFKELRKELQDTGVLFESDSDTEVILRAYKKWGTDCVKHFNGMWAFAIYDKAIKKLFLSRDRLGKKPLFYTLDRKNRLIFSSEIKPLFVHHLKKEINPSAVSSFLSYRYVLGEETMFKGIFKLMPARNMLYDLQSSQIEDIWQYWDLADNEIIQSDENLTKLNIEKLLNDAVSARQVSDVPIGSINSGGLDSSLISAIMAKQNQQKIRTFTIKFPEKGHDETAYAKMLAKHCKTIHKEVTVDTGNFLDAMKAYSKLKDEPIGVPSEVPLYQLFKKMKKDVTVILSGEGADELFAGYGRIFRSPHDFVGGDELEHFMDRYDYFPEKDIFLKDKYKADFKWFFTKYFSKIFRI